MRYGALVLFFTLIVVGSAPRCFAQDSLSPKVPREIEYDKTEGLEVPVFSKEKIADYKKDKAFNYTEAETSENGWTRFTNWLWHVWNSFWRWLFGDFEAGGFVSFLFHTLPYLFLLGIIIFVVWLFYKLNPGVVFFKSKQPPEVFFSEEEEIIKSKNIRKLIEKALESKDYRLAVRYYYLLILKRLTDAEIIHYEFDKTNSEYFAEIASDSLNKGFRKTTNLYDYIWYGNFTVTEDDFLKAQQTFVSLENQIPKTSE